MIVTPSERRRAARFHAAVEGHDEAAGTDATPVALAGRLRSIQVGGEVDPVFRARLRTRLLAVAAVQDTATATGPSRSEQDLRRPPRRVAVAVGTVAALVALSGVGVASNGAVPGDPLYSVKRSREAAQLALTQSDVSRGQLHLQFARTRLTEAGTVHDEPERLRRVLADMDADTRAGMRELSGTAVERQVRAPLDVVDEFVAAQRRRLVDLIGTLPEGRRSAALDSLALLEQVRERSGELRPSLLCTSGHAGADRSDELGPLPRRCAALPHVDPGGQTAPGGPPAARPPQRPTGQGTKPGGAATPSALPVPGGPGVSGQPAPPELNQPGNPTNAPSSGRTTQPSPTPSGPTQSLLGEVTDTVGGVVGGVLGPLVGGGSS